jgi:WD40 repeat protein
MVYDSFTKQAHSLVVGRAAFSLSWSPDGTEVTYDTWDGFIESVEVARAETTRLLRGDFPSWAPDGQRLAFLPDRSTVSIYHVGSKVSQEIHKRDGVRYFWKRQIVGPMYWSPDGRYLSFQVERWTLLLGSQLDCVVLDLTSQKEFSFDDGGLNCGPWVSAIAIPK